MPWQQRPGPVPRTPRNVLDTSSTIKATSMPGRLVQLPFAAEAMTITREAACRRTSRPGWRLRCCQHRWPSVMCSKVMLMNFPSVSANSSGRQRGGRPPVGVRTLVITQRLHRVSPEDGFRAVGAVARWQTTAPAFHFITTVHNSVAARP